MSGRLEKIVAGAALIVSASPAFAGVAGQAPAPAIGLGIGAVVLIGAAYRAVKARIR